MRTLNYTHKAYVIITSMLFILLTTSCSKKQKFLTSEVLPAAQGTVEIKQDNNNNYVIKIELSNLSPSSRLTPPANAYVVWMLTPNNESRNLGQINSSKKFMSNRLDAEFEAVSAIKPAKIVITAEDDVSVQYPSFGDPILITDYLK